MSRDDAFDRVLRDHGAAIRRVARSYELDAARRDDLFQDICLAIWRALPSFRGESSERTFVFRIAHNRGLTHRTRRTPAAAPLDAADHLAHPAPLPDTTLHQAQQRARLEAAVLQLPLPLRQVLTLTLEGLSQREIAEVLGITENNVAVRSTRARQQLRELLRPNGEHQ